MPPDSSAGAFPARQGRDHNTGIQQRTGRTGAVIPSIATLRDRLVSDPKFRRWAARFPLTRMVARRRTGQLFDLCAGFVYAQILHACLELDVFSILANGPVALPDLAARLDLPPESAQRLIDAAAALQLVDRRRGGRIGLGPLGAALVQNDAVAAMVAHHRMLYADLADPVALLRGQAGATSLSSYWAYARSQSPAEAGAAQTADYTALMATSQTLVAGEILAAYDLRPHRRLMDVGGGDGSFLAAAAARAPGLELVLYDLPAVAVQAQQRLAAAGLSARATAVGGSFLDGALPEGADLISLVRVVHDHDDDNVCQILRAVRVALPVGGKLLLAEPMARTPGAERMGDAYFGFYLLAMGSGKPRTPQRLRELLHDAGFAHVRQAPTATPLLTSLLVAQA